MGRRVPLRALEVPERWTLRHVLRRSGGPPRAIGFAVVPNIDPATSGFWAEVRETGGEEFAAALDYAGIDIYPDVFGPRIGPDALPGTVERLLRDFRERDLATAGSRVRLCKGAYDEPASVAYQRRAEVDASYVRCLNILLHGAGYPMFATHDPRLIEIAAARARYYRRTKDQFEFQMLYGIRPDEQRRLVADGHTVRVYVPYGAEWYGYLMRRLAERPANLTFFARALITKG